jgi:hypothetical protein
MHRVIISIFSLFLVCCKQQSSTKPLLSYKDSLKIDQLTFADSNVHLKKISELNADKVYRFSHNKAFCFYKQFVTIIKAGDSILLHYLEFSGTDDGNEIVYRNKKFGPGTRIEREFYKRLNKKDWEELEQKIKEANYWKIEEKDVRIVRDGSGWQVDAYLGSPETLNKEQVRVVYRNSPANNSFSSLGLFFMQLAEEKGQCDQFD